MSQDHYSGCWWLFDTTDGDVSHQVHSNHADDRQTQ
jgi:hypothetical protein